MSNDYEVIKQAIINKSSISATYKGYYREVSPHVIGTKNGRKQALFYQFGGESSSGAILPNAKSNWRCMPISELSNVSPINKGWHTVNSHSTAQSCVDTIDAEVRY